MRPAREGNIPVRVKNSYNPQAAGTLIKRTRDLSEVCVEIFSYILKEMLLFQPLGFVEIDFVKLFSWACAWDQTKNMNAFRVNVMSKHITSDLYT